MKASLGTCRKLSGLSELPNQTACCLKSPGDASASSGKSTLPSTKEEERQWSAEERTTSRYTHQLQDDGSSKVCLQPFTATKSCVCTGMVQRRKVMLHTWGLRIS